MKYEEMSDIITLHLNPYQIIEVSKEVIKGIKVVAVDYSIVNINNN